MDSQTCSCGAKGYLVLSCSGACDLGEIADLTARRLRNNGVRKMNCLALLGAGIESAATDFKQNDILVLDGCSVACGAKTLNRSGIENFTHVVVSDLGYVKGKTPVENSVLDDVYKKVEPIYQK